MHFHKQPENSNVLVVMGQPRLVAEAVMLKVRRAHQSQPASGLTTPLLLTSRQLLLQKIHPVFLSRLINSSLILLNEQGVH
jgi:hypothetical protein